MTITDAIVKVLMENSKGLTAKQIYEKIVEKIFRKFVGNCGEFYYLCTKN